MRYRYMPILTLTVLPFVGFTLPCEGDCWWFNQLEPEDSCEDYQEASVECKVEFTAKSALCSGCLKDKHLEVLGIGRGSPSPTSPVGEEVMDCFDQRVEKCEKEELGVVFANCVERVTGIPTIEEDG